MKKFSLILSIFCCFIVGLNAQIHNPVSWSTEVNIIDGTEAELLIKAEIEEGWHLYSQVLPNDEGPVATEFTFPESPNYSLIGKVNEPKAKTEFDPNFDMDLNYFEEAVVFVQKIRLETQEAFSITGEVYFMVCDDEKCLPPDYVDLEFQLNGGVATEESSSVGEVDLSEGESATESGEKEAVVWSFASEKVEEGVYDLKLTAQIDEGWHLYAQELQSDEGPIATSFIFKEEGFKKEGKVEERGEMHTDFDPNFEMDLNYYETEVTFVQRIVDAQADLKVNGDLEFMVCNDRMCLPPTIIEFQFDLASGKGVDRLYLETEGQKKIDVASIIPATPNVNLDEPLSSCVEGDQIREASSGAWLVFLGGFIGGLVALLTPCVFPMIPLTVSFFTKSSEKKGKGIFNAVLYGFFIFMIYAILSVPFHFGADPQVLNEIATGVVLNLFFFAVFAIFAISFFGYFEITMPSSLSNKADSASNIGGIIGIFFMALTLALVSFSCTGPILGTVLGSALKNGPWPITAAMSGFGIALGLPFAFFAAFPKVMERLPQSGGWLNSVKVVLGFVEIALAIKFLSNADLVVQWGLIKRETFFLLWALTGLGLVAYLLGWIRFPHDSPIRKFSMFRIGFIALVFAFTVYIAPGVLRNPTWNHNLLSGFPPPTFYSWYEKETFHAEFDDYDEAMEEVMALNKPLLIDFTGWACVNCRKMEETVWLDDSVKKILAEDFVLVSLYVDDKIKLPEEQQGVFEYMQEGQLKKKKIKTIGNKWATFQTHAFNNNSQPYYVMLSPDGYLLGNPVGYTPSIEEYKRYLKCGLEANQLHNSQLSSLQP